MSLEQVLHKRQMAQNWNLWKSQGADHHCGAAPRLQAAPDAGGLGPALDGGPEAHDGV